MVIQHAASLYYLMTALHIKLWTRDYYQALKNYFGSETRTRPVTNNTSSDSGWGDEETVQENVKHINWVSQNNFKNYILYISTLSHTFANMGKKLGGFQR